MNNEPVAWMNPLRPSEIYEDDNFDDLWKNEFIPLYTQEQLEEARKLGMQQERALWNLSESTQEIMKANPVKEPIYRFDDEMLTELITTMDSVDAYMEAERRGFNDAKWIDIANGEWQSLMKLIYEAVDRIEKNGKAQE